MMIISNNRDLYYDPWSLHACLARTRVPDHDDHDLVYYDDDCIHDDIADGCYNPWSLHACLTPSQQVTDDEEFITTVILVIEDHHSDDAQHSDGEWSLGIFSILIIIISISIPTCSSSKVGLTILSNPGCESAGHCDDDSQGKPGKTPKAESFS